MASVVVRRRSAGGGPAVVAEQDAQVEATAAEPEPAQRDDHVPAGTGQPGRCASVGRYLASASSVPVRGRAVPHSHAVRGFQTPVLQGFHHSPPLPATPVSGPAGPSSRTAFRPRRGRRRRRRRSRRRPSRCLPARACAHGGRRRRCRPPPAPLQPPARLSRDEDPTRPNEPRAGRRRLVERAAPPSRSARCSRRRQKERSRQHFAKRCERLGDDPVVRPASALLDQPCLEQHLRSRPIPAPSARLRRSRSGGRSGWTAPALGAAIGALAYQFVRGESA